MTVVYTNEREKAKSAAAEMLGQHNDELLPLSVDSWRPVIQSTNESRASNSSSSLDDPISEP